jgi:hypothetical protein
MNLRTSSCTAHELGESAQSRVSLVSVQSKHFSEQPLSNSMSLLLHSLDSPPSFLCVLVNTFPRQYTEENDLSREYLNVTCLEGDYTMHERVCVGAGVGGGNVTIAVACDGSAVTLSRQCPQRMIQPDCVPFGEGSSFQCTRVAYNSTSTTCFCNTSSSSSRRLTSDNPLLQVHSSLSHPSLCLTLRSCMLSIKKSSPSLRSQSSQQTI